MTLPNHSDEPTQWGSITNSPERSMALTIPARPELWGLARMAVASIASRLGFDFEEIEDLRLAVDELSMACASGIGPDSVLHLNCHWSEAGLFVECMVIPVVAVANGEDGQFPAGLSQKELSESILAVLVDAYGISLGEGSRRGWLRKDA